MRFFSSSSGKIIFIVTVLVLVSVIVGSNTLLAQPTPVLPITAAPVPSSYNPTPGPITATRASSTPVSDIPPEITQYAKDWPLPNRDYSSTRSTKDAAINSSNVNNLGVAWSMPIQGVEPTWGGAASAPIILGNNVFFQDLAYNVYSVNFQNGKTNWVNKYNTPFKGPNGLSAGWGKLFATTNLYNLAALDLNSGNLVWETRLATSNPYLKVNAVPIPWGGQVYTSDTPEDSVNNGGVSGYFYGLDQSNGAVKWSLSGVDDPETFWGHPEINSGGGAWMPSSIDTTNGMLFWGTKNPGNGSGPNGPYSGTLEYPNGASRPGMNLYSNCIMALDAKCGKLVWYNQAFPHDLYNHDFQNPPILCTANLFGKTTNIAIGSGKGGIVYAYNRENGGTLWVTPVGQHQYDNLQLLPDNPDLTMYPGVLGGVTTMPAYSDGMVFVPYCDLWSKYTSTGLVESQNLNSGTGGMAAIDVNTGSILWNIQLPQLCLGAATVVNDLVFTATIDGTIYALSVKTGQNVWTWKAPCGITGWPAVSGDSIVWPCGYGPQPALICLRLGAPKPTTATPTTTPPPTTTLPPAPSPTITAAPVPQNITINYFITQINNFNITNIWPGTTINFPSKAPHGSTCNTFVNVNVNTTIINKTGKVPEGGCIVLQSFDQNKKIIGYYVMVKIKGYDPENDDWFWCQYNADGTQTSQGKLNYCINCHSQRKNNDYCWTAPITQGTTLQPIPQQFPTPLITPSPTLSPLPGATPIPTIIPSITATTSPTASPSPSVAPSVTVSPSPSPSPTVTASPVISPSPTPTVTGTPTPSISPSPTVTILPSPSPTATFTPTPVPSASPTISPSVTPSPSVSPSPTQSPTPSPSLPPQQYTPITGWCNGAPVQYYNFGTNTPLANNAPATAVMYEFATSINANGTANLVSGQQPVIDVLPGQSGYSDLWQINLVMVPQGYQADTIRSVTDIMATGLTINPTSTLVNRPVVVSGSTVAGGKTLQQAWFQGKQVSYVDFGPNPKTTASVYILITGTSAQGNPVPVPGQNNIFQYLPGDPFYTAFCNVNLVTVPAGYTPNSLKSINDVLASGYAITTTNTLANLPIISPTVTPTPTPLSSPSPSLLPSSTPSPSPIIPSPFPSPSTTASATVAAATTTPPSGTRFPTLAPTTTTPGITTTVPATTSPSTTTTAVAPTTTAITSIPPSPSITAAPSTTAAAVPSPTGLPAITPTITTTPPARTPALPAPKQYTLLAGWYNGVAAQYFDFGSNTALLNNLPATAVMYEFATSINPNGTPNLVPDQQPVIDVLPGQSGYSDLWQINLVMVPQGYQANIIRSATDITATGLTINQTNSFVNRPVVGSGSTIAGGRTLATAWFQGQQVNYVDFGPNPKTIAPVYILITGTSAQGNPVPVPGQNNIFQFVSTEQGYSAFCVVNLVTVPGSYTPNTLKSVSDILASRYPVTPTSTLVNFPVVSPTQPVALPTPSTAVTPAPSSLTPVVTATPTGLLPTTTP